MPEERRLVTVLFADVVGSTTLGETLDPEDVRALLGRLFAIARDAVERHGGRVEKFIGDAIMAIFGLPIAHDDDPARALSAALELRDRVRADPALADRLAIRLGVNGGEVIASRDQDASEFLVTGDPVNTAARLQQAADPWAILVGDRTVRASGGRFRFGPPVAVTAKGKAQPVMAAPLEGIVEGRPAAPAGRIVGREADLAQLQLTARRAFDERRPYLVGVVAPAGVGKSRLLEEFVAHLDPGVVVATAQCLPYGQRLTYWPMRAILLSIVGLGDDAGPDRIRPRLGEWLREAGEPDADRIADQLAATIGAADLEAADRFALFAAWRRFVELAAERSPLVLVIEDLHWSSDSLLDLVESILQPRSDVPLLMIALARPELLDRRPSWGGGRRNAVSLSLDPLPSPAVAALVADLLPNPSPDVVAAVVERAEGNPFYAGEIVRSIIDRLGATPDPVELPAAIAALPDTVQATVLARLDALEPDPRRVVQLGAVLGRTFDPRAVPALDSEIDEPRVAAAVDALLDRDLVRPTGRGQLTFRHILIREVAYGMLPRAERARLHAAAGVWLESESTASAREDELAELVAFHFREASVLARLLAEPPTEDVRERAVHWLRRAAEVAFGAAATLEAARHLDAAIDLAPAAVQAELYERLGQVWVGGEQALEAYERAYRIGQELGLGNDQALATLAEDMIVRARFAGSIAGRLDDTEWHRRLAEIERLIAVATSDRAIALGALALGFNSGVANLPKAEELRVAGGWAAKALELARRLDDADLISAALDAVTAIHLGDNQFDKTRELLRERTDLDDRVGTNERLDAWNMTAWVDTILGRLELAESDAGHAVAGLSSGQAPAWVSGSRAWRVTALFFLGRWDDAVAEARRMQRAIAESEIQAPWYALNGILAAHEISRARGDLVAADEWRTAATTIFERSDPEIRTQRLLSFLTNDQEQLADAVVADYPTFTGRLDYVALALAKLADNRYGRNVSVLNALIPYMKDRSLLLVSAPAHRLRGIATADEAELRLALEGLEQMNARPQVARVHTELGLLTGDAALLEAGLADLEALGDLEQASRVGAERRALDAGDPPPWLAVPRPRATGALA